MDFILSKIISRPLRNNNCDKITIDALASNQIECDATISDNTVQRRN